MEPVRARFVPAEELPAMSRFARPAGRQVPVGDAPRIRQDVATTEKKCPKAVSDPVKEHETRDPTVTIDSASPPYVECIHWLPRKLASGAAAGTMADVVIDQRALQQIRTHAGAAPDVSVGGLLIGRVFRDPTCSRAWVMVEATEPAAAPFSDDPSAAELRRSLSSLAVPSVQVAIGWYRTHPRAGLYLSEAEAEFHQTSFPNAWQCAVVLLGDDERTTGGVFQRTERGLSRSAYAPFYELVDPSSELGGRTCRTFSGWSSYETQASVALAGRDGVSTELSPTAPQPAPTEPPSTEPSPTEPPLPLSATTSDAAQSAPPAQPITPPGEAVAERRTREVDGSDEAWSKLQIQRSLTAVGRTLTPSALGELGAPAPVVDPTNLEEGEAGEGQATDEGAARAPDSGAAPPGPVVQASEPQAAAIEPQATAIEPQALAIEPQATTVEPPGARTVEAPLSVGPATPAASAPSDREVAAAPAYPAADPPERSSDLTGSAAASAGGLVGGARRRPPRVPRKLAFAAATLLVMAAGIWVGLQIAGTGTVAIDEDPSRTDLAPAGIGLVDQPLIGDRSGAVDVPADPDTQKEVNALDPAPAGEGTGAPPPDAASSLESVAGADRAERATETSDGTSTAEPGGAEALPEAADADVPSPTATRPVAADRPPEPLPFVIDDPVVAAYEDALQIFGKETDRYDEARRDFDDGLQGCNPLNLAYRGVHESFERLSQRFEQAKALFAGPGLRAFESAERQAAVIQRHYELTDCPPPIGG